MLKRFFEWLGSLLSPKTKPAATSAPNVGTENLRQGDRGPAVKELQKFLKIEADGVFGPATAAAVRAYQKAQGIPADGVVGAVTRARMNWTPAGNPPPESTGPTPPATDIQGFLAFAATFLNVPYQWGGDYARWKAGKDFGLDCSGLEQALAAFQGIDIPGDQTADQILDLYMERGGQVIPDGQEQAGDRVFYEGATVDGRWTHIVVVVGKDKIIGANGGGSNTTTRAKAKEQGAFVRYDKLNYRKDKHLIVRPAGIKWK